MSAYKGMISNKLTKIAWYIGNVRLPQRQGLSYINFCIHTEVIYDSKTYQALLKFSKDFNELTGKKITVCVSTPVCPLVKKGLIENKLSEDAFSKRVLEVSKFAEIGYHGHFYPKGSTTFDHMRRADYDKDLVVGQISQEMTWFKNIGLYPKIFIAGCWFLMKEMVLELERWGIKVDVSVRRDKSDTFGGVYLDNSKVPQYGEPFILPPSKNVVEIQSLFGPVMHPAIMKGHLSQYMKDTKAPSPSFIFPLHDWDIPKYYSAIWANVVELCKYKNSVEWMNVMDMRDTYMNGQTG